MVVGEISLSERVDDAILVCTHHLAVQAMGMMMEPDAIKSPMYVTKATDKEKPQNTPSSIFTADANSGGDDDNDDGFVTLSAILNSAASS